MLPLAWSGTVVKGLSYSGVRVPSTLAVIFAIRGLQHGNVRDRTSVLMRYRKCAEFGCTGSCVAVGLRAGQFPVLRSRALALNPVPRRIGES